MVHLLFLLLLLLLLRDPTRVESIHHGLDDDSIQPEPSIEKSHHPLPFQQASE